MWRGTTSLPEGQAKCRPCRRIAKGWAPDELATKAMFGWKQERACKKCGTPFMPATNNQIYCSRGCRPNPRWGQKAATPQERGYGKEHLALRREWAKVVDRGEAFCWRCGIWIEPGMKWHLGHDDHDRSVYRGPECVPCNTSTAASRGNRERWRSPRVITRACAACGSTFSTVYPKQTYCSVECRPKRKPKVKRWAEPQPLVRTCPDCGCLTPKRGRCETCALERQRARYVPRARPSRTVTCAECGDEFTTVYGNARYCNARCRSHAGKRRYYATPSGAENRRRWRHPRRPAA